MHNGADRRAAHATWLTGATIDSGFELEIPGLAFGADKVAQAAAALPNRPRQHLDDGRMQTPSAGTRHLAGRQRRANTRHEQRFGRVDVAHTHHDVTGQQHLLDRRRTLAQRGMESGCVKTATQRLHPQVPQQLAGLW